MELLKDNKDDIIKFLSIEKDGPRPRKDISKYSDVKEEFSYAIDSIFEQENYSKYDGDKTYDVALVLDYVNNYLDLDCTNEEWFNKVKEFAINKGYAGRTKSPDLFSILKILGKEKILKRIDLYKSKIEK